MLFSPAPLHQYVAIQMRLASRITQTLHIDEGAD